MRQFGGIMIKSSDLSWIVVSDLKKAKQFFTETIGLKEHSYSEAFGWAELKGESGGALIGLAEESPMMEDMKAGQNAVVTLTVDDIEKVSQEIEKKGVKLIGEMIEVPGHVKMQMFSDLDGNLFQLVEQLD